MVIDARTGEVLHSRNADTRLHPASLTKMMTLYVAFQAVEHGELTLDTPILISKKAAAEPPSKIGLKSGQRVALRYLIRAASVKSANDAATAIGEGISGSEAAFARRMNRTAAALGMSRTTFKNAHGLTESGHLSTASDMTTLGRHLFYDYPEYYNLFSRMSTSTMGKTVHNTNRRLLAAYKGADGIKTGYTRAAGFNLVASAERGNERIIATVFGGRSSATRNAKVAELLDLGFRRAPTRVATRKPSKPAYTPNDNGPAPVMTAQLESPTPAPKTGEGIYKGKTIRVSGTVAKSLRPRRRPGSEPAAPATDAADELLLAALSEEIDSAVAAVVNEAVAEAVPAQPAAEEVAKLASAAPAADLENEAQVAEALAELKDAPVKDGEAGETLTLASVSPVARPVVDADVEEVPGSAGDLEMAVAEEPGGFTAAGGPAISSALLPKPRPVRTARPAPEGVQLASAEAAPAALAAAPARIQPEEPVVITRTSTSGGKLWAISLGKYPSRFSAEKVLLKTALKEMETLDGSLRKVNNRKGGFEAIFVGLSANKARLACARLEARGTTCTALEPGQG
ncbi:D-alanyl-D-alanine carboxypeptidase family protein [Vannielia litorea]|uniref:D-alanyl-D-alanine carboxypeptidase family protein n=1 Tax=Vannielia litorea TaxID=1217970 RepID=UPI001BCF3F5D|nr:D-alanyl-D-alanine carboxypeptidase family protein [Vannielia litorea]MBS8226096.1 D-alanyl-D-alanine carboxypeptidase [Vannielia litorea]